jgi:hypothetical protein
MKYKFTVCVGNQNSCSSHYCDMYVFVNDEGIVQQFR